MDAIKLIWFESKKQITSFPFIITLVLLTVFSFTQMSEVFHIPVNIVLVNEILLMCPTRTKS